ncbi:succinate dehydrogenase/fumarate reductase iron-sulfur subunit [Candidatus Thorarchaeota archaeon]|nr:MAG: succinate dehydrogenase/fumarate reductase iron-sulfur subunit [Candidatus Thorarchaeota archaeon]
MILRIARSRQGGKITHYDLYKVQFEKGMSILDVLFQVQDRMDPSLSFRYSCRGAVCGSCGMLINKMPRLACRTQPETVMDESMNLQDFPPIMGRPEGWDPEKEILIEPLPNLPILKDLVVDMTAFYAALEELRLWAEPAEGEKARNQKPDQRDKIRRYLNCIMCALCYGSCPINHESAEYLGPAALAKAWRFYDDSRTPNADRYLKDALKPNGAPMCELIMNCVRACPKGVAPGGAIRKIKSHDKE